MAHTVVVAVVITVAALAGGCLPGRDGGGFLHDDTPSGVFDDYRWGYTFHWDDPRQGVHGGDAFDDGHTTYVLLPEGVTALGAWRRYAGRNTPAPFSRSSPYLLLTGVALHGGWILSTSHGPLRITPQAAPPDTAAATANTPNPQPATVVPPPQAAPPVETPHGDTSVDIENSVQINNATAIAQPGIPAGLKAAVRVAEPAPHPQHAPPWGHHRLAFDGADATLNPRAQQQLLALAPEARGASRLLLRGMAAAGGRALAEARARAVRDVFEAIGVAASRIQLLPWERERNENAVELYLLPDGHNAPL